MWMRRNGHSEWTVALAMGVTYLALGGAAVGLTRFRGGVAFISVANAVLLARMLTVAPPRWWRPVAASAIAAMVLTALVGLGPLGAVPMMLANMSEVCLVAWLLARSAAGRDRTGSRAPLPLFLLVAGVVAPACSATLGAGVATWLGGDSYGGNWFNWFTGHSLGLLTVTPVATYILRGDVRDWGAWASKWRSLEAVGHLALVAGVTWIVFRQSSQPLLFLPMLPIILATFRLGRIGAAFAIVVLTVVAGGLTLTGVGPIGALPEPFPERVQLLQFFLGCTVVTMLPIAAELARREATHRRLLESEARYRLLTENSGDVVLNIDPGGRIRYASPSVERIAGYRPDELVGRVAADLVDPRDVAAAAATHVAALRDPSRTFIVEYRARSLDGGEIWLESHTRAVVDRDGRLAGAVSIVRDVDHRKRREDDLSRAALSDALTGIANRRAFEQELLHLIEASPERGSAGCVAMFDLDHFKRINDRHGHAAGDEVLKAFARVAASKLRSGDLVARTGGEEFAVILADATPGQAAAVCERIREAFAALPIVHAGTVMRATASCGVAALEGGSTMSATLAEADAALYEAKRAGRNRLALAA